MVICGALGDKENTWQMCLCVFCRRLADTTNPSGLFPPKRRGGLAGLLCLVLRGWSLQGDKTRLLCSPRAAGDVREAVRGCERRSSQVLASASARVTRVGPVGGVRAGKCLWLPVGGIHQGDKGGEVVSGATRGTRLGFLAC